MLQKKKTIINILANNTNRTVKCMSQEVIRLLYSALVRLYLKYCIQFGAPYFNKKVDKLKRAQSRTVEVTGVLGNTIYEESEGTGII